MVNEAESNKTDNQALQQRLIDRAIQEPGIAEAFAAYETIRPYLAQQPAAARPQVRFATGGNN